MIFTGEFRVHKDGQCKPTKRHHYPHATTLFQSDTFGTCTFSNSSTCNGQRYLDKKGMFSIRSRQDHIIFMALTELWTRIKFYLLFAYAQDADIPKRQFGSRKLKCRPECRALRSFIWVEVRLSLFTSDRTHLRPYAMRLVTSFTALAALFASEAVKGQGILHGAISLDPTATVLQDITGA